MATTKEIIRLWLREGVRKYATHMIVKHDSCDGSDYPLYVRANEDAREVAAQNSDKTMECYNLSMDLEKQLKQPRAWNW